MSAPAVEPKESEEITSISDANVLTKYKEAAKIATDALNLILKSASKGIAILDLAKMSDELIFERTSKLYNSKKGIMKGVAFPTSISRNNVVGHFAPMEKDQDQPMLETGDIVKVSVASFIHALIYTHILTIIIIMSHNHTTALFTVHSIHQCSPFLLLSSHGFV